MVTHSFGGFLWPENDKVTPAVVMREVERLPAYLKYVSNRRVCVQAGGNVGVYAERLAGQFGAVLTFEPDPDNWHCLQQNITAPNVTARHAALGEGPGFVETWRTEKEQHNYGATLIRPAQAGAEVVMLDSLDLPALDFLFLDVEGYEWPALKGAVETIKRFQPIISVEMKGLGRVFNYSNTDLELWLEAQGYRRCDAIGRDVIFRPLV
jgi:FkbM family methyltransferase